MPKYIKDLQQIFKAGVRAVLPENLIKKAVSYDVYKQQLTIKGKHYNLEDKNLYLVGAGKAVQNMAIEIEDMLSGKLKHGIVSIPIGSYNSKRHKSTSSIQFFEGAKNNLPDAAAADTADRIKDLAVALKSHDVLLVLLSGGGSALLPSTKTPITLEQKTAVIKTIAYAGADITELNTVRKRISDLKGGQLAINAQPAQIISLILSDIVGDPLDLIASGPTVENKDFPSQALDVITKYKIENAIPPSVKEVLEKSEAVTKFPDDNVSNYIIGCNSLSIAAAAEEAKTLGYRTYELSNIVTGNVKDVAQKYINLTTALCNYISNKINKKVLQDQLTNCNLPLNKEFVNDIAKVKDLREKPLCLILGGETTVEVTGNGVGGRNQHLALEFSKLLHDKDAIFKDFDIHFLSAGTDGFDGPTDAAGAIGSNNLVQESITEDLNIDKYLINNDSYYFYKSFKNGEFHVVTGHTNTNVMDLHILTITVK